MARPSELRFSERDGYHSTIAKRKYYFGQDKTAAQIAFGNKLRQQQQGRVFSDQLVSVIVDEFIEYQRTLNKERTVDWYWKPLKDFMGYVGVNCRVSQLGVADVEKWVAKNWSTTTRGTPVAENTLKHPLRAVKSCFHWASTKGNLIPDNPFKLVEIGEYSGTEEIPSVEQLALVLQHFSHDKDFIDLLQFEALTVARVEEVRFIKSSQLNIKTKTILLNKEQTKLYKRLKKKRLREIFLNDAALKIAKRNAEKHPDGLMFQNPLSLRSDNGWKPNTIGSRFARAEKTLGFRIQQKGLRHLFATRYLKASQSVAGGMALLGHTTPKMIMVNYNKVLQDKEHLLEEVNRVKLIRPKAIKNGTTNNGNPDNTQE